MNTFKILKMEYAKIEKQGFIRCLNNNKNSSGETLEKLLGSTGGDFNVPDFYDIEIKALRKYWKCEFDLFNSAPDGSVVNSTKWIADNFGYPDRTFRNVKVIKGDVYANRLNRIGINYLFKLKINYNKKRIYLIVLDNNLKLVSDDIYWDFDSLKEKLERKISKLAIISFDKKIIDDDYYIHYNDIKMYKLTSFDNFIRCIEKNIIWLTFKNGVFKSGKYKGKFTDHGTSFRISKNNLHHLFNRVVP